MHGFRGLTLENVSDTDYTDFADLIVEQNVILELKSVTSITKIHEVQIVNYLKATGLEVGLLINFGHSVEIKRKVMDKSDNTVYKLNP